VCETQASSDQAVADACAWFSSPRCGRLSGGGLGETVHVPSFVSATPTPTSAGSLGMTTVPSTVECEVGCMGAPCASRGLVHRGGGAAGGLSGGSRGGIGCGSTDFVGIGGTVHFPGFLSSPPTPTSAGPLGMTTAPCGPFGLAKSAMVWLVPFEFPFAKTALGPHNWPALDVKATTVTFSSPNVLACIVRRAHMGVTAAGCQEATSPPPTMFAKRPGADLDSASLRAIILSGSAASCFTSSARAALRPLGV